jgi:hypothetical protein
MCQDYELIVECDWRNVNHCFSIQKEWRARQQPNELEVHKSWRLLKATIDLGNDDPDLGGVSGDGDEIGAGSRWSGPDFYYSNMQGL